MKQYNRLLIAFCMLWPILLLAEVRIIITKGIDSARPIAVIPFKWTGPGEHPPQEVAAIIAADLRNSGKFNPIEVENMPQKPTTVSEVTPALWKNLGIDAVVIGQLQVGEDGSFLVSYQLVSTASLSAANGIVLEQNQYRALTPWLRYAAHKVSDRVFEKLTAIKGAFSTRIAYVMHVNDAKYPYELKVADYDGHNQFMLYRSLEPIMSLAWSPDGRKLAYVTFENQHSELILHDLASAKRQRLAAFPRHNGAPAFSFDGTQLALALSKDGSLKIYLMDLASHQLTRITEGNSNDTEPAWHPDGKSIIFTSDRGGRPEIYRLNLPGGQISRLTWHGGQNQGGKITPDGRSLVMVNRGDDGYHIARQDLATSTVQVLTNTFLDEAPSIAPNGTMIIYSSTETVGKVLQLVSMDGRFKARLLATNGQVRFPAWSPYL